MSGIQSSSVVSITLNGQAKTFTWDEFTTALTHYECFESECATEIASSNSLDIFWLLFAGIMVLLLQMGFTLLEVGSVRIQNARNIVTKNLGDCCLGAICFYAAGYGFASTAGNILVGDSGFALTGPLFSHGTQAINYADWLYKWSMSAVVVAIVSGAVAERINVIAYLTYTCIITTIVYPFVLHWVWSSTGWASPIRTSDRLMDVGVLDFSGCSVIHITGGMLALIGCIIIGPREGRFNSLGHPVNLVRQSAALRTIGTIILWVGWYGLSCGSTLTLAGNSADVVAKIAVNVTLAAAMSGLSCIAWGKLIKPFALDPSLMNEGILAGLVGISAGCATVEGYSALIIGFLSSIVFLASSKALLFFKIDDAVDAISIHLFVGIWGMLAAGLFSTPENYALAYGRFNVPTSCGILYSCSGNGGSQLLINFVFSLVAIGWAGMFGLLIFIPLRALGLLYRSDIDDYETLHDSQYDSKTAHLLPANVMAMDYPPFSESSSEFTRIASPTEANLQTTEYSYRPTSQLSSLETCAEASDDNNSYDLNGGSQRQTNISSQYHPTNVSSTEYSFGSSQPSTEGTKTTAEYSFESNSQNTSFATQPSRTLSHQSSRTYSQQTSQTFSDFAASDITTDDPYNYSDEPSPHYRPTDDSHYVAYEDDL